MRGQSAFTANAWGRCTTMRRTETSIQAATLTS
jgi:hypothetical protein